MKGEDDQEVPHLHTTDQPMALRGRNTEHSVSDNIERILHECSCFIEFIKRVGGKR